MTMPVDVKQADKQPAQTKSHQPDGVERRKGNTVMDNRNHRRGTQPARQHDNARSKRHHAAHCAAKPGNPAAQRLIK
ncbi:hypothetical protein D3C78_1081540 [compost metagenome]